MATPAGIREGLEGDFGNFSYAGQDQHLPFDELLYHSPPSSIDYRAAGSDLEADLQTHVFSCAE